MATPTSGAVPVARNEPRTRTALLLEAIALRHQIAVLERSRARRPCFRRIDRLLWILLSGWWPQWRESLLIVQPETVLRWRRSGWLALWRYRSWGHWRGGRPRVSGEVRNLIRQMARENLLWGAPRIHGELLMLEYTVSQATVSRYLPAPGRRPTQSWRSFLRNQLARSATIPRRGRGGPRVRMFAPIGPTSCDLRLRRLRRSVSGSGAALATNSLARNARRIRLRSAQRERAAMHRVPRLAAGFGAPQDARSNRLSSAVAVRSPPSKARASSRPRSRANQDVAFCVDQVLRSDRTQNPSRSSSCGFKSCPRHQNSSRQCCDFQRRALSLQAFSN